MSNVAHSLSPNSYTDDFISLSELLCLPMPLLPTISNKSDSIQIGASGGNTSDDAEDGLFSTGGKWEDEEERRFFEDIQDLKDFVPRNFLGIEDEGRDETEGKDRAEKERAEAEAEAEAEAKKLEKELEGLKANGDAHSNGFASGNRAESVDEESDR